MQDAQPEPVRTMSVQPPRNAQITIRLVEFDGVDLQPCGGTHVAFTDKIGKVRVQKMKRRASAIAVLAPDSRYRERMTPVGGGDVKNSLLMQKLMGKTQIRQWANARPCAAPRGHKGTEAQACIQSGRAGRAAQVGPRRSGRPAGSLAIFRATMHTLDIDSMTASQVALHEGLLFDIQRQTLTNLTSRYSIDTSRVVETTATRLFHHVAEL